MPTVSRRGLIAAGLAAPFLPSLALAQAAARPSLYDILREPEILDAALSPSGSDIAILGERVEGTLRTTYLTLLSGADPAGPSVASTWATSISRRSPSPRTTACSSG